MDKGSQEAGTQGQIRAGGILGTPVLGGFLEEVGRREVVVVGGGGIW